MMPFPYGAQEQVPKMVPQVPVQEEKVEAPVVLAQLPPFMMTPKQQYLNTMEECKLDEELKQKMATLFEFGFVDYAVNLDQL